LASNELESATQKLNSATSNLDELAHKVCVFSSKLTDMDRDGALQAAISDLKKQTGVGSAPSMAVGAHASSASGANNEEAGGVPGSSAGGANKEEVQVVEDSRDNNNRVNIVPPGDGRGSGHQLDTDETDIVVAGDEQRTLVKESGTAHCPDGKQKEMASSSNALARTVVLAAADTQGKIAAAEGASGAQLQDAGETDGKNK
jgi:hypothetical protein